MDQETTQAEALLARWQAILAWYQETGKTPDPHKLLRRFPELDEHIRAYVANHAYMASQGTQMIGGHAQAPTDGVATAPEPHTDEPHTAEPGTGQPRTGDDAPTEGGKMLAATPNLDYASTIDTRTPGERLPGRCGQQFGDYELVEEIAHGGMGVVYKAVQKSLHRVVALKMILAGQLASADQIRRFRTEAEEAGHLDHPNIVPIYQVGEEDGQHYFTMKFIEGGPLSARIKKFAGKTRAAARLVADVARAVHYAHQHGILHRDIKPGNILLDAERQPHITDFGVAKHLAGGPEAVTQSGAIIGTPSYMAPEQAAARKNLTTAVDIYSLGAVLYELLTGRPPFQADNSLETLVKVMDRDPARPRTLNPDLDQDLETICLKCLRKEPSQRYPSAEDLAQDLERWLVGEPIQARRVGAGERFRKWLRRRPAAAALLAVSVVAVLALVFGGVWHNLSLGRALDEAEKNAEESRRQRDLAQANFQKRLDVVDDMLVRMDGRLANVNGVQQLRLEFLNEALRLSQSLLADQPKDATARRHTARVHRTMGELWEKAERFREADQAYARALELYRQLAQEFPEQPMHQDQVAETLAQRARLQRNSRLLPLAQATFREAIAIQDRLVDGAPEEFDHRERAARYRFGLARALEEFGNPAGAKAMYQEALERMDQLAADYSKRAVVHYYLATFATGLALVESDLAAAEKLLFRAVAAGRQAHALAPMGEYDRSLEESYAELAAFLLHHGRHAELARMAHEYRLDFRQPGGSTYNVACFLGNAAGAVARNADIPEAERGSLAEAHGAAAVTMLAKSIKEGYTQRVHMDLDPDLDPLRSRADFRELMADLGRRFPLTAAKHLAALKKEYLGAETQADYLRRTALPASYRKRAYERPFEDFAERFLKLAESHKDSPVAVQALVWVINAGEVDDDDTRSTGFLPPLPRGEAVGKLREKAIAILERDHLEKPEFGEVCQRLLPAALPECDRLLRAAIQKHAQADVRGLASFALGLSLARQSDQIRGRNDVRADELSSLAEKHLEEVLAKYKDIPYGPTSLGEMTKLKLHEVRFLSVGRTAMDIEGDDLEGKRFKLSDYRGKVVVVDFWAHWCGWCRQMYPIEKKMVDSLKEQPFALLGVNCDENRNQIRMVAHKEKLNWRSWWDGDRGPITEKWQVNAFPTIYVLDHHGVIRFKRVSARELESAVAILLQELQAEKSLEKK